MNVGKHPQRNIYKAFALLGVLSLGTLTLFLFVSSFCAKAVPLENTTTPRTFADWCLNKPKFSVETRRTNDDGAYVSGLA